MRAKLAFLFVVLCTVFLRNTCAKPAESLSKPPSIDPASELLSVDVKREQRSPQFGLLDDYSDYSNEEDYVEPRHLLGRKHKLNKHHKPLGLIGHGQGHGCRGHECGGWQPEYSGYHPGGHESGHGGSFATASAGSGSGGGGHNGGHSEANAQSASFSFGPYTASFSVAQASSGHDHY